MTEEYKDFDDMDIHPKILRGIYSYGFEKPSTIQAKAIVPIIKGNDILAQSQSGTGKTGTFVIGILSKINENLNYVQALIIVPTHELANQIKMVCDNIAKWTNFKSCLCIGGLDVHLNHENLNESHIAIGTPGRICDLIQRNYIRTSQISICILDEADDLLSKDFQHQIRKIIEKFSTQTQICVFSATYPKHVIDVTHKFLQNPVKILVHQEELTLEGIKQYYVNVQKEHYKYTTLCDLYQALTISQSIIYVNTKKKADWLYEKLNSDSYTVDFIHSEMNSVDRYNVLKRFRNGEFRVLISTDLLSRGIDIQQVSIVINYDLPNNNENYLHRIGRSGRFGRKGIAINLITFETKRRLADFERFYNTKVEEMPTDIADQL
jgi:translation initiation factor 4A